MSSDDVYTDHHRRLPGSVGPPDNHCPVGPAPSCGVKGIHQQLSNIWNNDLLQLNMLCEIISFLRKFRKLFYIFA